MPVILGGNTGIYLASLTPTPAVDPDAQAFITAAAITDPTQQAAINTLVVDLKGYNVWTKMKAIYPMVGGTAATHKFNLKDPRDLNAAFRLQFFGGWTHSNTGAKGNGSNAYANTFFAPNPQLNVYNTSCSYYSRINVNEGNKPALGAGTGYTPLTAFAIYAPDSYYGSPNFGASQVSFSDINSLGFYSGTRTAINNAKIYKNGVLRATNTTNPTSLNLTTTNLVLNAFSVTGFIESFSAKECAFASIGDGLTDTEAANFYTAVQTFQTTLGRSIGTQTVSDADAQAFVTNAGIVDQVEANAINNLVIGMKADGLWTKMKAVYPFVGGSSTSNSYNLVNTAQYQLSFSGGATHNSNGYTGGVNGYANTGLNPNTAFSTNNSGHLSLYSRTNNSGGFGDFGILNASALTTLNASFSGTASTLIHGGTGVSTANANSTGFYVGTRTSASVLKLFKNNTQLGSTYTGANGARGDLNIFLGALNVTGTAQYYTQRNYAFASIGDGLTDTDASNLNTRVTTFQTALNRNI